MRVRALPSLSLQWLCVKLQSTQCLVEHNLRIRQHKMTCGLIVIIIIQSLDSVPWEFCSHYLWSLLITFKQEVHCQWHSLSNCPSLDNTNIIYLNKCIQCLSCNHVSYKLQLCFACFIDLSQRASSYKRPLYYMHYKRPLPFYQHYLSSLLHLLQLCCCSIILSRLYHKNLSIAHLFYR